MISFHEVTAHYGVRPVLRKVSMTVQPGELVAVMGPNGMGKSTLLSVAAGTLAPLKGEVKIAGKQRRITPEDELAIRKSTVYLPDHPWLPVSRTGREFLLAVGAIYEVDSERAMDHTGRLLELFDLRKVDDSPIRTYSNGQKKKIAICSALVAERPVMILDEPFTGGLDPSGVLALKRVLGHLAERKDVTVLMATQLSDIAEAIAHRIAVLREGELVTYDTPEKIKQKHGAGGNLEEALDKLIHPETLGRIDDYFEGRE